MPTPCRRCLVKSCGCTSLNKSEDRKLYTFPSSSTLRSAWLRLLRIDEDLVGSTSRVCSKHFERGSKSRGNKLPIIDIGLTEEEKRLIIADYMHQVVLKSQRPLETVIEDAIIFMGKDDKYDTNNVGKDRFLVFEVLIKLV